MALYQYSWTILFAPLLAFVIIVFGTRMWDLFSRPRAAVADQSGGHASHTPQEHGTESKEHDSQEEDDNPLVPQITLGARVSGYVGIVLMAFACVYSWVLLAGSLLNPEALGKNGIDVFSYPWLSFGPISYTITFHLDNLAIAMMVVVTTISLLVQIYSQGYMANSAGYARFFSYLSLFAFSMLVIVFAQNFLVIFIGWELVGLSSYLLIGFWINKRAKPEEQRPSPSSAALQAFVMNRIGDVGFIIGIMILFMTTGTFEFSKLFSAAGNLDKTLLTVAMICVFCGAIGKSAQIPLHTWLPPAMEGPTPVSALIHAATMVAAGVYMVARTYPLFVAAGPAALGTVAWIGGLTALFAATVALVQSDFKRVLAFSTISQLGYMFVGLGVASAEFGTGPGMFHLFTHAFFKALLFLGAGSVIDALHHATHKEVQDMRLMGGLATKMPVTALTWLVATLAISGFPGFSGFFSKEFIIGQALENGQIALYIITLLTAGLTAFYMLRAFILAFGGKGGALGGLWGGPYRGSGDPHESPLTMTIPLVVLAIFSVFAGYWTGFFQYINPGNEEIHSLSIPTLLSTWDTWLGVVVSLAGLVVAYAIYARVELAKIHETVQNNALLRVLHRILYNRYYIDTLYDWIVRYIVLGVSYLAQAFDAYIVDGIVNGVAWLVTGLGDETRRVETGRVQAYMIGFFGGIAVLAVVVFMLVIR
ncbi:MAG: NADH-quinone oxidoreductase subunit L [Ktedonobacteraceae bacterium]|nr:NADH-quinone oxidoreductase subunit L [Ktedonobacteraceae bacterium]